VRNLQTVSDTKCTCPTLGHKCDQMLCCLRFAVDITVFSDARRVQDPPFAYHFMQRAM
jgi:hypothetical protein